MSDPTPTLVEFLIARLDEDEAAAKAALSDPGHWTGNPPEMAFVAADTDDGVWTTGSHDSSCEVSGVGIFIYDEGGHNAAQARHIARHDPARVLAECTAHRRIVQLHPNDYGECETCAGEEGFSEDSDGNREWSRPARSWPCETLRALAAIWSDHPDFAGLEGS